MSTIFPPHIPSHARRIEVTRGTELPDRTLTWIDDATSQPYQFGTIAHTFELRIDRYDSVFVKTTGISGSNNDPNILITFASGELDTFTPGHYHAQLRAKRTSDGKDLEPIDLRFVVNKLIGSP
jgi:hypothetical protein